MMCLKIPVVLLITALILTGTEARTCLEHLAEANENMMPGTFIPQCDTDGTYAPSQCRGSECYCVDVDGRELGFNTNRGPAAANMDCNCARDQAAYQGLSIIGRMFVCDSTGSYERAQCTGSVCYCVDVSGNQRPNGEEKHISNFNELNCPDIRS